MARVIMLKRLDRVPRLVSALATDYDDQTGMVRLSESIDLGDGQPTDIVPLALCYAYDERLLDLVNTLSGSAVDKLRAAVQHLEAELRPAEFKVEGADGMWETPQEPPVKWH